MSAYKSHYNAPQFPSTNHFGNASPGTFNESSEYYNNYGEDYSGSGNDLTLKCSKGPNVVIPILCSLIAIVGLLGNSFVLYIIIKLKEFRKSTTNYYILQLAVADFLFLSVLPFETASLLYEERWIYGTAWCKITQSIRMLNYYASILFLTMMSVDRYLAIHGMNSSKKVARYRSKRFVAFISSFIWLMGFACVIYVLIKAKTVHCLCTIAFGDEKVNHVVIPPGYFEKLNISTNEMFEHHINLLPGHCSYKGYHELNRWIIINFITAFLTPLVIISICYILILQKISKTTSAVGVRNQSSNRARKRVTNMVIALVTVFIVCWLPYYTFNLSRINESQLSKYACEALNYFTYVFAFMNSALNPYFYILMGSNIKKRWNDMMRRTRTLRRSLSLTGQNQGSKKRRRRLSSRMSVTGNCKGTDDSSFSHSQNVTKHTELMTQDALLSAEEHRL